MIDIQGSDNSVLTTALTVLVKALGTARKATEALALDTMQIQTMEGRAEEIAKASASNVGREHWKLAPHLGPTLAVGVGLLIEKLDKIKQGQMELGIIEPDDTDKRLSEARSLAARLIGTRGDQAQRIIDGVLDHAEGLRPKKGSGIDSVTVSSGRRSVTLEAK